MCGSRARGERADRIAHRERVPDAHAECDAVPAAQVADDGNLSEAARSVFRRALTGGVELPRGEVPRVFRDGDDVRYRGETYEVRTRETDGQVTGYSIAPGDVPDSENVSAGITYANLSDAGQRVFREALEDGRCEVWGERLPAGLHESRYVRYGGEVYDLNLAVGEAPAWEVTVEKV